MKLDPIFLVDVDGVLANFVQGVIDRFDLPVTHAEFVSWGHYQKFGITDEELWSKIDNEFWLGLQPYPWAKELLAELRSRGNVIFATSPSLEAECPTAKIRWLRDNGFMGKVNDYMIGPHKWLMSGNGLLIDDAEKNVEAFRGQSGGQAILFPQPWNEEGEKRSPVPFVLNQVDRWLAE